MLLTLIISVISAIIGAVVGVFGMILYDRSKRPVPNYNFDFEKEVSYRGAVGFGNYVMPTIGHIPNYIRIENYGDDSLFNVSTKVWFDTRKERRYYQTMGIKESLFDWESEYLPVYSYKRAQYDSLLSMRGKGEVFEEKIKQGFFIPNKAIGKLKSLSPIKVKVEYEWDDKKDSDIWLFDFSDENEVRFYLPRLTLWQKIKLVLKRAFL